MRLTPLLVLIFSLVGMTAARADEVTYSFSGHTTWIDPLLSSYYSVGANTLSGTITLDLGVEALSVPQIPEYAFPGSVSALFSASGKTISGSGGDVAYFPATDFERVIDGSAWSHGSATVVGDTSGLEFVGFDLLTVAPVLIGTPSLRDVLSVPANGVSFEILYTDPSGQDGELISVQWQLDSLTRVSPVPELGAVWLLLAGLLIVGTGARRRYAPNVT